MSYLMQNKGFSLWATPHKSVVLSDSWPETFVSCHPLHAFPAALHFELSNEGGHTKR